MERFSDDWSITSPDSNFTVWYVHNSDYKPKIKTVSIGGKMLCHVVKISRYPLIFHSSEHNEVYELNFETGSNKQHKWRLKCFNSVCNHLSFGLELVDSFPFDSPVHVSLRTSEPDSPCIDKSYLPGQIWGMNKYKSYANTIKVEIGFVIEVYEDRPDKEKSWMDTSRVIIDLLFSHDYDVSLVGDDWEYKAHKQVLATNSPVFNAMFRHEMSESTSGKILIEDIKGTTVLAMLHFVYTGKVSDMNSSCHELLIVSDKYQMEELKKFCVSYLSQNISRTNVLNHIFSADLFDLNDLKKSCFHFLTTNFDEVITTDKWKEIETSNRVLTSIIKYQAKLIKSLKK